MKSSIYNIFFDYENKKFAFNSFTCTFAEINNNFLKLLDSVGTSNTHFSKEDSELIKNMKKGGFVIDDCFDELELLKFNNYRSKFNNDRLSITIAPTFACNFACPYCYESTKNEVMSKEVLDAICKKVENAAKYKKTINVTWYGGEPLLTKNMIWDLSKKLIKICDDAGALYNADIVTNGYLIDDETISNFLKYKIASVQVTLDGPPDIHNSRRKLRNSSKPTFDTILSNAKKTIDAGIRVSIRINVDKTNVGKVDELLDILITHKLNDAFVYLGHVRPSTEACKSIGGSCLNKRDYALKRTNFEKLLLQKGFNSKYYPSYPRVKGRFCCADSISSIVVAPDGSLYKCWHDIGNKNMCVGNLKNPQNETSESIITNVKYLLCSPFENDICVKCNVLPLCMGGCPSIEKDNSLTACESWKYNLIETLKVKYDSTKIK